MGRKTHGTNRKIKVTNRVREVAALVAAQHARSEDVTPGAFLAGRVFGSRTITRRMYKGLRSQLAP